MVRPPGVPPLWIVCALAAASGLTLFLALPVQREVVRTTAPHTPHDVEPFGGLRIIGQAFHAPRDGMSEIQVFLRLPLPREAFPMVLHLRHGRYSVHDVRTVTLTEDDLTSDGRLRARFHPVRKSAGLPYVFMLESLRAPTGSVAAYHQIDGSIYGQGYLFWVHPNLDRPGDLEFALVAREPRGLEAWRRFLSAVGTSVTPVGTSVTPQPYRRPALIIGSLIITSIFVFLRWARAASRRQWVSVLAALALAHVLLHLPFLFTYPGVNDEGAYLMDIQNLRVGLWPFRDTLAKGPVFLALLTPIGLLFPPTLTPARLAVVGFSVVELVLLASLARRLAGPAAGILAAALWALSPVVVAQTSQLFIQAFSLPFVTLALLLLVPSRPSEHAVPRPLTVWFPRWAGILLALAYLTRASSLAFAVPAVALCTLHGEALRSGTRRAGILLASMLGTLGIAGLLLFPFLGRERTFVFFNLEAFIIGQARSDGGGLINPALLIPREILERVVAYGDMLLRTGLPLLLLWLAFLSSRLLKLVRSRRLLLIFPFLIVVVPLLLRVSRVNYGLLDDTGGIGETFRTFSLLMTLGISALLVWPRGRETFRGTDAAAALSARPAAERQAVAIVLLGWLSLLFLYIFFGRFRQPYHAEFLPLYVLGSALFLARELPQFLIRQPPRNAPSRPALHGAVASLLFLTTAAFLAVAYVPARRQPHSGSIPPAVARRVGMILRQNSSGGEEILTAQGLFTFYAHRPLPFGASHPGWYLEERVGTVPPELRRLFLPDKDVIRRYVRERPIRLIAIDRRTREVYFAYDPAMSALLADEYELLSTVPNPLEEGPVEIWKRKGS